LAAYAFVRGSFTTVGWNKRSAFHLPPQAERGFSAHSDFALKLPRTRLHARHCLRCLKARFRPEGGLLFFGFRPKKSNQKKCDPMSAPSKHLSVFTRSPALLGQGGVFRQAIPGLSENASASCLARVCARLFHLGLRCSAQPDGEVSQKHGRSQSNIKSVALSCL
jgi:hypothetical protein